MAHQYTCSECAFQIRSEKDDELIEFVRTHADDAHGLGMSRADVRDGWEQVSVEADD